jgi:mRNA interferase HigB
VLAKCLHWRSQFANIPVVNVISKRCLFEKAEQYPDAKAALQTWFAVASTAEWSSLTDIRKTYPATDMVGDLAIFNIRGNHYRLVVRMAFRARRIYVKEFLTHAEYDKGGWKRWL